MLPWHMGGKSILAWTVIATTTAMLGEFCGLLATRNLQAHQIIFAFVWFYQGWKYTWKEQSNLFRGHSCMWSSHALLLCDLENDVSWCGPNIVHIKCWIESQLSFVFINNLVNWNELSCEAISNRVLNHRRKKI